MGGRRLGLGTLANAAEPGKQVDVDNPHENSKPDLPMTQEVRPMYHHDVVATARRAASRSLARHMLLIVVASALGLLYGTQGLAPANAAVVRAAQSDAKAPGDSGPPSDVLDDGVVSTGAPDEQIDVSAALDQGTRLFSLQARYQDDDYYVAGPQGVSHQPLRELFAPMGDWLAAPGHEHELVWLALQTDPRSANPARFAAACQAFTSALGPYLLKASDLPEGKTLDELTPDEQAALQSQPRVITDWSACTGEQPPLGGPQVAPTPATTSYEHWMADMASVIGQRPLRQVVIPGSHDAATYENADCTDWWTGTDCNWDPITGPLAQAQGLDIAGQLDAGSRYFDLRFTTYVWGDSIDYFNFHGIAISRNSMKSTLDKLFSWLELPGHEREIIVLDFTFGNAAGSDPDRLNQLCSDYLSSSGRVLQPSMVPPNTNLYDMSMNEIWALPGHPQLIVKGWDGCTAQTWPPAPPPGTAATPISNYYSNLCDGPDIASAIGTPLQNRTDITGAVETGLYGLDVQATPPCGTKSVKDLAIEQQQPLGMLVYWWAQDQNNALANLNFVVGDFLGTQGVPGGSVFVPVTADLNRTAQAPQLDLTTDAQAPKPVTLTCTDPRGSPPTLVVYPVTQGPQSPNSKTFTATAGTASVQASLSLDDFPGAGNDPSGFVRAECAQGAAPNQVSRLVIPLNDFGRLVLLPHKVGGDAESLACVALSPVAGPLTINVYPTAEGPQGPHHYSGSGQPDETISPPQFAWPIARSDFPAGDYQLTATCVSTDSPPVTATPLTFGTSDLPKGDPSLSLDAPQEAPGFVDCIPYGPATDPLTINAYPSAEGPQGPHHHSTSGQPVDLGNGLLGWPMALGGAKFPPGDYVMTVTCASSDSPPLTAPPLFLDSASFTPVSLSLVDWGTDSAELRVGCLIHGPVPGQLTMTMYSTAEGPQGPHKTLTEQPFDLGNGRTGIAYDTSWSNFPAGQVAVTCASSDSSALTAAPLTYDSPLATPTPTATAPATPTSPATPTGSPTAPATPTPTATATGPAGKLTADITGCSAQGASEYACALRVTLGPALLVDAVLSVDIGGSAFSNPSGADSPEVTTSQGCDVPPLPSPYLATGDRYTRYAVNISSGGCQAGAVVTLKEVVAGTAGATITQSVTAPGLNAATATFVLPAAAATPRPTEAATPTPTARDG